ncbi:hypothetical protein KIW84_023998 [Lathyrus oleraceus]|uniref:Uncharacterized protein n=1 Tax=Pisum sativum TaxID=3888 RepID=A0A9D4YIZ5_PEA|nr:hypothetical protein KIW84_023998 [Pisum sativum]
MYARKMSTQTDNDQLLIHYFQDSLTDRDQLRVMSQKDKETFKEYAQRWRELAAQIVPPLEEKEMTKIFLKTLSSFYYERMIVSAPSDFTDGEYGDEARRGGWDTTEKWNYHAIKWDTITKHKYEGGLVLRKLDKKNKAYLMKLVWKLLNGNEDLWCTILKHNYKMSKSIGDGTYIDLWSDCWIKSGVTIQELDLQIPVKLEHEKWKYLVGQEGGWNWHNLQQWLSDSLIQKIKVHLPPRPEYRNDEFVIAVSGNSGSFVKEMDCHKPGQLWMNKVHANIMMDFFSMELDE